MKLIENIILDVFRASSNVYYDYFIFSVYSWFAALEYVVIFTNIFFHATLYWDVGEYDLGIIHRDVMPRLEKNA